ncbi:MAG: hypothetical protein KF807_04535 [Xanthobacteraceae bacterium]|nr:hypothetical protein [Xanthobacteraceae bacterium]
MSTPEMPAATSDTRNVLLVFAGAYFVLIAQMMWMYSLPSALVLPDADDAMRLVQMRDFLAGHGWYDLHQARLSPPAGYDSHWSRLIDAGLASLHFFFRGFAGAALAERLTIIVWPLLWLLPAMTGVAMIAWRLGGHAAVPATLLFAAFCGPGMQQFIPGRIDHHNVHIALSILAIACTICADRVRFAAAGAGVLSALALAIGFESLPFLLLCGAAFALRFVIDRHAATQLRDYGAALAAATLIVFVLSVPVQRWSAAVCDMIAVNSAVPVIIAGAMAAIAACLRGETASSRFALLAAGGVLSALVFVLIEPRCLGGVYALVDPAIRPIWLNDVSETKTLIEMTARGPATGAGIAAFPIVGLIALLFWLRTMRRAWNYPSLVTAAAFSLSILYMIAVARGSSYAVWLGMPVVALALLHIFRALHRTSLGTRFALNFLLTPTVVTVGAIVLAGAAGGTIDLRSADRQACVIAQNYAAVAALPKGVVAVNEMEWGPYALAWSGQSVLAAPYHRIPAAIIASYKIFNTKPDEARHAAQQAGVDYLLVCRPTPPSHVSHAEWQESVLGQIASGKTPAWLKMISAGPVALYRVERAAP